MRLTLASERADALRESEERLRRAEADILKAEQARLRDLDLKIVALQAQRGSLAAGPPEGVEEALNRAKASRKQAEADLSARLSAVRGSEAAAVRERIEAREADLERGTAVSDAARRRDDEAALRAYHEAVGAAERSLPAIEVTPEPAASPIGRTERAAGPAAVHVRASRRAPVRGPGGNVVSESDAAIRSLVRADLMAHAVRVGRQRGWRAVFVRSPGLTDRTDEVLSALREERFLK
jgi:hypothetical protein